MAWLTRLYEEDKLSKYLHRIDEGSRCAVYAWIDCAKRNQVTTFLSELKRKDNISYVKLESLIGVVCNQKLSNKRKYEEYSNEIKGILALKTQKHRIYGFKIDNQIVLIEGMLKNPKWPTKEQVKVINKTKDKYYKVLINFKV